MLIKSGAAQKGDPGGTLEEGVDVTAGHPAGRRIITGRGFRLDCDIDFVWIYGVCMLGLSNTLRLSSSDHEKACEITAYCDCSFLHKDEYVKTFRQRARLVLEELTFSATSLKLMTATATADSRGLMMKDNRTKPSPSTFLTSPAASLKQTDLCDEDSNRQTPSLGNQSGSFRGAFLPNRKRNQQEAENPRLEQFKHLKWPLNNSLAEKSAKQGRYTPPLR
ncbi:uncharacterized [Tachysurus ichikawai]